MFILDQGWGLRSQFSPFRYFPHFPLLSKQTLAIEYHVYIWQVSPQLSCGDTCQIWMWFRESNRYFCKIENFAYGEISERNFSNPHPSTWVRMWCSLNQPNPVNTLKLRQNGRHFTDNIFKCFSLNENFLISNKVSVKYVPWGLIDDIAALAHIMAGHWTGDKPLPEPMMA